MSVKSNSDKYNHRSIEKKWQDKWEKDALYYPDIEGTSKKDKYYNLWMFPYPSAEGLHAGHAFASTGSDIYGRFMRMNGKVIFQPIGYDSFGIHSENYALKIKENPNQVVRRTTKNYEKQMRSLGHGYDWTRTVTTSSVDYYKWTEWLFTTLFKAGLAYRKKQKVNFCPSCKTVLADEQVMTPKQAGKEAKDAKGNIVKGEDLRVCERCGTIVEDKNLEQWLFRITDYADRLLDNLEKIDWTEKVKLAQREWIGKSRGLTIDFKVQGLNKRISVWTKFWETVFGTTFLVVSPEYAKENLLKIIPKKFKSKVSKYIEISLKKSEKERSEVKEKSGVLMGIEATNLVNHRKVPVYVADYVLANVGTGAVMGVPAHDERDFEFARKNKLPVIKVVDVQVETHIVAIKKSLDKGFSKEIEKNGWYKMDYEDWGIGVVIPKGEEGKYIKIVQKYLKEGPWYVHTDGVAKKVIFKDRVFDIGKENVEAKKYASNLGIPKKQQDWDQVDNYMFCHEKGGLVVNSSQFDGLDAWGEGKKKMAKWMIEKEISRWETNYHLRDWLISRQRYWGCPIPMIYCETCAKAGRGYLGSNKSKLIHKDQNDWDSNGWWPEENLPVELPEISDWEPEGTGKGPLANHPEYFETKCPNCGSDAIRETDVADTFLDSSWYFLRYPSVRSKTKDKLPFDSEISKKWLPVDLYFGGAEHSVLHLMYARFVNMVLNDLKLLDHEEPFPKFYAHGLMIKDGAKMSKSRGNVVNPDEYIDKFGADALRMYLVFMGPMDGYPDFRDTGIEGMNRFVSKLWKMFVKSSDKEKSDGQVTSKLHQTIKKVTEEVSEFKYNTAIAAIMEYVNVLNEKKNYSKTYLKPLVKLAAPFVPHMAEEVWHEVFGEKESIHISDWPEFDKTKIASDTVKIVVQVNGKLRSTFEINADMAKVKEEVLNKARSDEKVSKWLEGKKMIKEIFVPGKLVNFVVQG